MATVATYITTKSNEWVLETAGVKSRSFKCSFDQAKRAFYRSLNAVFGHIGRSASEEVVINLVTHKCHPILLYGNGSLSSI